MRHVEKLAIAILLWTWALGTASAQSSECPTGNLLHRKSPVVWEGVNDTQRITDQSADAEGAFWNTTLTSQMLSSASSIIYRLDRPTRLRGLVLQGDGNDTYAVSTSMDGRSFQFLWEAVPVEGHGMRTRSVKDIDVLAQFIKVHDPEGDESYSISEFAAYCQLPAEFPPKFAFGKIPPKVHSPLAEVAKKLGLSKLAIERADVAWERLSIAGFKIAIGILAILGFGLLLRLSQQREERIRRRQLVTAVFFSALALGFALYRAHGIYVAAGTTLALIALGTYGFLKLNMRRLSIHGERLALICFALAGAYGWTSFLDFHGGGHPLHMHEAFHYHLGPKYFKENGYTRLYECAALAEAEGGRQHLVERRKLRSLEDYTLYRGPKALKDPSMCKSHFTDARWQEFKKDVDYFKRHFHLGHWQNVLFADHGYNATPVWNLFGSLITKNVEVSDAWMRYLAMIDPILYLASFALMLWAFGLRTMSLAMVIWGIGFPWDFYYNGGAFARVPWLFTAVAGLCFLKKEKGVWGGACLALSVLLLWFPAAFVLGIVIKLGHSLWKRRRLSKLEQRVVIGALACSAVLLPWAAYEAGGANAYKEQLKKVAMHSATPFTNHMGIRTVFAWHPQRTAARLYDSRLSDPYDRYQVMRVATFKSRIVFYWITILAAMAVFAWVVTRRPLWVGVALGPLIVYLFFEPACYYYSFILLSVPIAIRRADGAEILITASLLTQIVRVVIGGSDQGYAACALIVGAALFYMLALAASRHFRFSDLEDETEPVHPGKPEEKSMANNAQSLAV